jgi:hypothetical protein
MSIAMTCFETFSMIEHLIENFNWSLLYFWRRPVDFLLIEIEEVLAMLPYIEAGRFHELKFRTVEDYITKIDLLRHRATKAMSQDDIRSRSLWLTKIARLAQVAQNLRLSYFDSSLREQPFGILLIGPPGCGKSSSAVRIAQRLCESIGKPLLRSDMVVLNESDDFQSEYRSNHRVVIFDDVAATKPDMDTGNPFRKVIDFINNIRKTSLNPHLELKGNIQIEPEIVICTMNRAGPMNTWSVEPSALFRRFKAVIVLNDEKLGALTTIISTQPNAKNIKEMNLFGKAPAGAEFTNLYDSYGGKATTGSNISLFENKFVDVTTLIPKIIDLYTDHREEQRNFVDFINSTFHEPPTVWKRFQQFLSSYNPWTKKRIVAHETQPMLVDSNTPLLVSQSSSHIDNRDIGTTRETLEPQMGEWSNFLSTDEEVVNFGTLDDDSASTIYEPHHGSDSDNDLVDEFEDDAVLERWFGSRKTNPLHLSLAHMLDSQLNDDKRIYGFNRDHYEELRPLLSDATQVSVLPYGFANGDVEYVASGYAQTIVRPSMYRTYLLEDLDMWYLQTCYDPDFAHPNENEITEIRESKHKDDETTTHDDFNLDNYSDNQESLSHDSCSDDDDSSNDSSVEDVYPHTNIVAVESTSQNDEVLQKMFSCFKFPDMYYNCKNVRQLRTFCKHFSWHFVLEWCLVNGNTPIDAIMWDHENKVLYVVEAKTSASKAQRAKARKQIVNAVNIAASVFLPIDPTIRVVGLLVYHTQKKYVFQTFRGAVLKYWKQECEQNMRRAADATMDYECME